MNAARLLAGAGFAALLLLSTPAAFTHDHERVATVSRDAADLLDVLARDGAGLQAPLEAARLLLADGGAGEAPTDETAAADKAVVLPDGPPVFALALLAPLLQDVALETGTLGHRELMAASAPSGGRALLLKSGAFTLDALFEALAGGEQKGLLAESGEGYRLNIPLVIAEGAALVLADGDHLELATERGAFIVNQGLLRIVDSAVTGSAANGRVLDFHPFIMTVRGGRARIDNSRFSDLGYDGQPLMSGLSFASSLFAGKKSSGSVADSVLTNIRSVEVTGIDAFLFERNRVEAARGIGVRLERLGASVIRDNVIFASGQHGLLLIGGKDAAVTGNVIAQNAGRGIFARDGVGHLTMLANVLVANGAEGISLAGGACVDIFANAAVDNRRDGIGVAQSFGVRVSDNLLAQNRGAGLAVSDSITPDDVTQITGNRFLANISGISGERFARLLLKGNDFSNQLPVLFAGALQYETPRYLTFMRDHAGMDDTGFEISGADTGTPSLFRGNLGRFSLSDFSGCDYGEGQ